LSKDSIYNGSIKRAAVKQSRLALSLRGHEPTLIAETGAPAPGGGSSRSQHRLCEGKLDQQPVAPASQEYLTALRASLAIVGRSCYARLHHLIVPQASCDRETSRAPACQLEVKPMEQSYRLRGERAPAADRPERADSAYYARLETGARWLAERAGSAGERLEHLGKAEDYARRRLETAADPGASR
jgi:hypothetical protein